MWNEFVQSVIEEIQEPAGALRAAKASESQ